MSCALAAAQQLIPCDSLPSNSSFMRLFIHTCLTHSLALLPDLLLLLSSSASHNQHQLQPPLLSSSLHPPPAASPPIESFFTCLRLLTETRAPSLSMAFNSCAERQTQAAATQPIHASAEYELSDAIGQMIQLVCRFCTHNNRLVREDCVAGED